MKIKWVGMVQALLLMATIVASIFALFVQMHIWNGLDLLALILAGLFLASCYIEDNR